MQTRDEAALVKLVASDARWIADGGGKIVGAATHIVNGHDRVSRMAFGVSRKVESKVHGEIIALLGEAAIAWKMGDHIFDDEHRLGRKAHRAFLRRSQSAEASALSRVIRAVPLCPVSGYACVMLERPDVEEKVR